MGLHLDCTEIVLPGPPPRRTYIFLLTQVEQYLSHKESTFSCSRERVPGMDSTWHPVVLSVGPWGKHEEVGWQTYLDPSS